MYHEIPIMPLNAVLFPGMPMPLIVFEARYRQMIEECLEQETPFGIALIREGVEVGGPAIPWEIGTIANLVRAVQVQEGTLPVLTVGTQRFRLEALLQTEPYLLADVEVLPEGDRDDAPAELHDDLRELFRNHLRLVLEMLGQPNAELSMPDSASRLSYMVAAHLTCAPVARQRLLEMDSVAERLFHEKHMLEKEGEEYRLLLAARKRYDEGGGRVHEDAFVLN